MLFASLFTVLAVTAAPLASAFTIAVPTNPTSGQVTEIHWTFTVADPAVFTLLLTNSTNHFEVKALVGEKVETDLGQITYQLPKLPAM
ncbi:hypothetical protein B0H14DRAFT_3513674 [Mycena olivaceomarginata]|nr:hypothetical protein B0H14DRAFT_3513674 [Mycena olivaceomarginata]